ncbi:MAG: hypothetical protein JO023_13775, partial [Chloroflexi bacterium]|nr:hypothetical protein [Chloroflexota bacterium]
ALDVAELGLFVTTPEVPSLKRTQGCMRLLQQLDFPIQKVQIVLNRVNSKTGVSEAEAAQAVPITWRVANDSAAMTAAAFGQPVVLSQPKTQLARDISGITRQLAGLPLETHRFGWLPWRGARRARSKMSRHADDNCAALRSTQ